MTLLDFLDPVSLDKPENPYISGANTFSRNITVHTPDFELKNLDPYDIAIIGVQEDRNSNNKGASLAPDKIRAQLYQLIKVSDKIRIIDLGNLKQGNTFNDTYSALKEVVNILVSNNLVSIIIGGTQELTIPVFQVFEKIRSNINVTAIDRTIDLVEDSINSSSETYLSEILFKKRSLFKFCSLGYQLHLTKSGNIDLINKLYYDAFRLGEIRSDISMVEPLLRDTDIVSFDISSVRQSEAPAFIKPSPSGFYSEEVCQLARYSGLSEKISVFGLFEVNPKYDINDQTVNLAAQIVWYFLDGYSCRKVEFPSGENKNFKTFIVGHSDLDYEITFYKSTVSERWWMEVPNPKNETTVLVSCSYADYQKACEQEVPDIWWKCFQKLS
ncbi:MAG: formimidoylglutamase [Bacteroidales bacterium]|nr:formimidoylglutamase [Bacteroidales bacterium]